MSFEPKEYCLTDICDDVSYGYTASANEECIGPKFLRITDIQGGLCNWNAVPYCNIDPKNKSKYNLEIGDIVIARTGNSTGENYIIQDDIDSVFASYLIRYRINKSIADPYFVWLNLRTDNWWRYVNGAKTGSAQAGANAKVLGSYPLSLPSLTRQVGISKLFKIINGKIFENTKINQTLEQMAQALFKSWFVDFEPVKAKIATLEAGGSQEDATLAAMTAISGKDADALMAFEREHPEQYAELKSTAELFPSAMQNSELGEIPEGWELKTFGKVSNCHDKKRIPLSKPQREKKKGDIPYYGATSIMDYVDEYIFDGIYLLLGEDGSVIKENGLPFTQYIWGKSWVNNHAHVLTGTGSVTTEHLMVFIKQKNIAAYVTGAVQMKLNQKNMNSIPFIFADEAVNNVFGQRIASIYAVVRAKSEENLTLTSLRDTLLPKLLSGEITLPETEQAVSEVENV
ncbi:TPA: restriction endonuclease subunit S [Serratia marcescens]